MTTAPEKNVTLLRTAYQAVESGDLDAAEQMLTEGFIANVPGSPAPLVGRDVWRLGTQAMKDAVPDLKMKVQDTFGVGDKVTVLLHFEGTHQGAFRQIEATGRQVSFGSIGVYRIEGHKIAEEWGRPGHDRPHTADLARRR
ncbi:ester cyclase [Streptomyces sp. NPDC054946]